MKTIEQIIEAREAYGAASDVYTEYEKARAELTLDLAIAERGGDAAAIEAAKAAQVKSSEGWHILYNARRVAAVDLLAAIDVDPAVIKYII